jgi:NADH:ubiquinone oxidoreductase subunit 6 (subunit J)
MADDSDDTTIQMRRADDRMHAEFKRRCAYYAMVMLMMLFAPGFLADGTDMPERWASLWGTGVWAFASIILGAMGVEGIQAWASAKRQT